MRSTIPYSNPVGACMATLEVGQPMLIIEAGSPKATALAKVTSRIRRVEKLGAGTFVYTKNHTYFIDKKHQVFGPL